MKNEYNTTNDLEKSIVNLQKKGLFFLVLLLILWGVSLVLAYYLGKSTAARQIVPVIEVVKDSASTDSTFLINKNDVNIDLDRIGERRTMERMRKHKKNLDDNYWLKETVIK